MTSRPPERARRRRRGPLRLLAALIRGLLVFVGQALLIAYLLVSRMFLVFGALYLVVYFLAGSGPFKGLIQQVISDQIPGTITAATAQWGPLPWELRIADGRIFDEHGRVAIRVKAVDATIDLGVTLPGLATFIMDSAHEPMRVRFSDVELLEPEADIRVEEDGHVNIERAFVIDGWRPHNEPGTIDTPLYFDLTARTVRSSTPAGASTGRASPPSATASTPSPTSRSPARTTSSSRRSR
ncbi:MAG: hypothetical protein U1F43_28515 [Myxococcota bacterium]